MKVDVCDTQCWFGREIPRRAANQPIIANAIYALASRHISLLSETEKDDSPRYVDECLQILLQILEDPLGHSDENLLAGVILMRSHEELSGKTNLARAWAMVDFPSRKRRALSPTRINEAP